MEQQPKQPDAKNPSPPEMLAKEHKSGKERPAEPTRFGDWEVSGRCVDF